MWFLEWDSSIIAPNGRVADSMPKVSGVVSSDQVRVIENHSLVGEAPTVLRTEDL
jgi:hypothetical protein